MKLNNKGFTLVEVMAGFSLLIVIMVSLVKIINLSSELTAAAVDFKTKSMSFYERYYSGMNYKADNNSPAFRLSKNSINLVKETITITEETSSDSLYSGQLVSIELNDVKLKKIENIYDDKISRIIVHRYVRDK